MANWISFIRTLLSIFIIVLLFSTTRSHYSWAFFLTILVIWMDGLDGFVARKFNEASKSGAVIDILCDRIVEYVYWIGFLALDWIPWWITLLVIIRGVVVDGLRSLALEKGFTAFGSTSVMRHPLGILLVSSRFSRWSYAICKALTFSIMILAHMPNWPFEFPASTVHNIAMASAYATLFFCLVRGLPVIIETRRFLSPSTS